MSTTVYSLYYIREADEGPRTAAHDARSFYFGEKQIPVVVENSSSFWYVPIVDEDGDIALVQTLGDDIGDHCILIVRPLVCNESNMLKEVVSSKGVTIIGKQARQTTCFHGGDTEIEDGIVWVASGATLSITGVGGERLLYTWDGEKGKWTTEMEATRRFRESIEKGAVEILSPDKEESNGRTR